MKHLLLTTIAAVLVVGCGESQQSALPPEAKPVEPVVEAAKPEPPPAKVPVSLIIGIAEGNIKAVKQHLAAGTDVNAKDKDDKYGTTLLHRAAGGGQTEIVELLIAKGADVNAKSGFGTPLDMAERIETKPELADLLRKHGGKTGAELKAEGK